jgi:hypothetical protein
MAVGVRTVSSDGEFPSTEKVCPSEGWGASAYGSSSGQRRLVYCNNAARSLPGTLDSFNSIAETATAESTVLDADGVTAFTIKQEYSPSGVEGVFSNRVTIKNFVTEAFRNVRYHRAMDWYIDSTAFSEIVTVGWHRRDGPARVRAQSRRLWRRLWRLDGSGDVVE